MKNWYGNNNGPINLTFSGIMTSKFKCWSRPDRYHWSSSGYWLIVASGRCWTRRRDVTTTMATLWWHRYSNDYALVLPHVTVCRLSCPSDRRCAETHADSAVLRISLYLRDRLHSHISSMLTASSLHDSHNHMSRELFFNMSSLASSLSRFVSLSSVIPNTYDNELCSW